VNIHTLACVGVVTVWRYPYVGGRSCVDALKDVGKRSAVVSKASRNITKKW